MFLSQSSLNAMDFRDPLVKQCTANMSPPFGLPYNKLFGTIPCFSDSMGSFRRNMEDSSCKTNPLATGFSITSGAAFGREISLNSVMTGLAEFVNTFDQAMPSHEGHPVQFIDFKCLGVMNLPEANPQDNSFQLKSFMCSMVNKPISPRLRMTYAQVTKLPPCPQKVFAKLQNVPAKPVCKSDSFNIYSQQGNHCKKVSPCQKIIPKTMVRNKGKNQFPTSISNEVAESPLCKEVEIRKEVEVNNKKIRKSRGKKKRRKGKRELGGKGVNLPGDLDGSLGASQDTDNSLTIPPSPPAVQTPVSPCISPLNKDSLFMKTTVGRLDLPRKDSESSEEPLVCKPIARLRSLSDCSIGSLDSEDSFIVFASEVGTEENCDDFSDSSDSDSDGDEVDFVCEPWKKRCTSSQDSPNSLNSSHTKRVRFSENIVVHPMVVWSCAQRLARAGPWEQMARDRARFACRISETGNILGPILDPCHRETVYLQRFSTTA